MLHDLNAWIWIADICFPQRDELRDAFMGVLRNNHQEQIIKSLRIASGSDQSRWFEASWKLIEVGFDPVLVKAVDLGYSLVMLEVPPPRNLAPHGVCLADLPMVTRGARRIAVLAETGLDDFLASTPLLEALRVGTREIPIRVVCSQDQAPLLEGFELQILDWGLFRRDENYRDIQMNAMRTFGPDLLVNLDRRRGVAGDFLAQAAGAAGALAIENQTQAEMSDEHRRLNRPYRVLLLKNHPYEVFIQRLGLPPAQPRLWPDSASRDQARAVLGRTWEPRRTLAVLGDAPAALAGAGALGLDRALRDGWTAIGLGGPGTQAVLGQALAPFGAKAVNQGGVLPLAAMAAVLQACGAFLGGSPTFQALAGAAGCRPFEPGSSRP
jgi:hypothetical protein